MAKMVPGTSNVLEDDLRKYVRPINPRGSKHPIFKDSGPKTHRWYGFWNQKPHILDTWTLWVCDLGQPRDKAFVAVIN